MLNQSQLGEPLLCKVLFSLSSIIKMNDSLIWLSISSNTIHIPLQRKLEKRYPTVNDIGSLYCRNGFITIVSKNQLKFWLVPKRERNLKRFSDTAVVIVFDRYQETNRKTIGLFGGILNAYISFHIFHKNHLFAARIVFWWMLVGGCGHVIANNQ